MKKFLALSIVIVILITSVLCGCTSNDSNDYVINSTNIIRIGAILPLSGDYVDLGQSISEGINYAASLAPNVQLDAEYTIMLDIKDSSADIKETAKSMISHNVSAVICAGGDKNYTDEIIAAFEGTETPLVFVDCYSDSVGLTDNVYSISLPYGYQSSAVYSYLLNQMYYSGAIVCAADDAYSKSFAEYFRTMFEQYAGQSASTYYYTGEEANFNAGTIAGAGLDFVYVLGNINDSKKIYLELMSAGVTSQIVFSEVFDKTQLESTDYNNVTFISNFELDDNNYIGSDFINNYSEEKDISSGSISAATAYGYDAYMLIYEAIHSFNSGTQSPIFSTTEATTASEEDTAVKVSEISTAIRGIEHYGVTDSISFDENGVANPTFLYVDKIENSQAVMQNRYDYSNEQN